MGRAALEVADIFRIHGPAWREAQRGHLSLAQLKVMSAIEQCRTAALGGDVLHCDGCGADQVSYNSCLMGSDLLWGVQRQKGMLHAASRPFDSPLRFALQEREQFVGRPELALA